MEITVRYFAAIRERLGLSEETFTLPDEEGVSLGVLWEHLVERHPGLQPLRAIIRVSVNLEFASDQTIVHDGDEVALIPPVAGGHDQPERLSAAPLRLEAVIDRVRHPEAGAIATFTGVVRNHSKGRAVKTLEYEVYPAMAIAKLTEIERGVEAEIPETRCAICHRHGRLEVGDLAVVIAVSAPHRAQAFEACARHRLDQGERPHMEEGDRT